MKAFLCHASNDKDFVGRVATKLGRVNAIYDDFNFASGVDFRAAIQKNLDDASVFAFFVSKSSLESVWCRYELSEAEMRLIRGSLAGQLAIVIDPQVSFSDLPGWMANCRALRTQNTNQASRELVGELTARSDQASRKPFIGREELLREISEGLNPYDEEPPHIILTTGLSGIGRRSSVDRAIRDNLGLPLGPSIVLGPTSGPLDLYLWLLEETASIESLKDLDSEATAFEALSEMDKVGELSGRLLQLASQRTVPCLVDEGGMLQGSGAFRPEFWSTFVQLLESGTDAYLALALRRRPYIPDSYRFGFLTARMERMSDDEVRRLLLTLLRQSRLSPTELEIAELVEYLDGYPPAVYFAVSHAKSYGVSALLADKSALQDFKAQRFERFVNDLRLSPEQWTILQYLAGEQLLPLDAIATAIDKDLRATAVTIKELVDLSLVSADDNEFGISTPIKAAVSRIKGVLPTRTYAKVAERLRTTYWSDPTQIPSLSIIDASLRAGAFSNDSKGEPLLRDVARSRVSTIHRIASDSYDARDYDRAAAYAERVYDLDPRRLSALEILYKCHARRGKWSDADSVLEQIRALKGRKYHFLKGFGARLQDRNSDAIREFRLAIASGDDDYPVHRELSRCLLHVGELSEALQEVQLTLARRPGDLYQLDVLAQIQIASGDFVGADSTLRQLEAVDFKQQFINHRRATFWAKRQDFPKALQYADLAVQVGSDQFEARAQRVNIIIESGDFDTSIRELQEILRRWPHRSKDVQAGLRCKALARRGLWEDGLQVWETLKDKSKPVHRALRKALLLAKATDQRLSLTERAEAKGQADAISSDSSLIDDFGFITSDGLLD